MVSQLEDYVPRAMLPVLADALSSARVVALLGPRQSGKTTLARRMLPGAGGGTFVTFDRDGERVAARADPATYIAQLPHGSIIDEVQRVPEILLAIKERVDQDNAPGQLLLTGSANLRRLPQIADALPGRVDYLTLWPLAQAELARTTRTLLPRLLEGDVPQLLGAPLGTAEYLDRIVTGGFPEAQRRTASQRTRFFRSYIDGIVDRDLADAGTLRRPELASDLLRLVAARSGSLMAFERIGTELGLDGKTARSYLETLERLFLIRVRRAWTTNLGKRQIRSSKCYVADTGLLAALVGSNSARLAKDRGLAGAFLETFVTLELERQESWGVDPMTLWHFREREDEVDIVAEAASGEVVGVEVKAAGTVRRSDFRGLTRLRDQLGTQFRCGCVLYAGERTLPVGDRLWALPLQALWTP